DVLLGARSITETHISTITDTILLLSYIELGGQLRRAITIVKMRGSRHKVDIYEFEIDDQGIQVRDPFRYIDNLLTGNPQNSFQQERRAMDDLMGPS
nr:hypothetical protein [Chloroflexaceae bacterium]